MNELELELHHAFTKVREQNTTVPLLDKLYRVGDVHFRPLPTRILTIPEVTERGDGAYRYQAERAAGDERKETDNEPWHEMGDAGPAGRRLTRDHIAVRRRLRCKRGATSDGTRHNGPSISTRTSFTGVHICTATAPNEEATAIACGTA